MRRMANRILGWVIVLIVIMYHGLRLLLVQCSGPSCDAYSPLTLLLPIAALVLAGVTGGMAAYQARAHPRWTLVLTACTVLGAIGPIIAAFALTDNDTKIWVSTVLVLTVPVTVGMWITARPVPRPS